MNTSQITDSCVTLIRVALFTVLLAQSQSAMGDGFRLSPLKLYFDANSNTASLKIQNDSASKVNLQLEAVTWSQDKDGEDLYSPTREIIFFPKILTIEAHGEQIVRVGYQGAPAHSKEKSYRLFVQELPVEIPGEARMAFAVRMSIPVFVRPVENDRAWHMEPVGFADQGLGIRVINTGNRYLMVGAMLAIGRDGNGQEVTRSEGTGWYVLAGQDRRFVLPVTKESCEEIMTMEVTVTVNKDTRTQRLEKLNCDEMGSTDPQSPRVTSAN